MKEIINSQQAKVEIVRKGEDLYFAVPAKDLPRKFKVTAQWIKKNDEALLIYTVTKQ